MTTHCSPSPGATTQQLVCHGPAGNPTTSTFVLSAGAVTTCRGYRRARAGRERLSPRPSVDSHLRRPSIAAAAAHVTPEGTRVPSSSKREREIARQRYERRQQRE